ncbi:Leucine Rich Repeat [Seminavis robusta]|uniref:Leucine Rich Repeat n=1 Tax=Seminavis robusta TaxID=568900 RepID=A0A9N8HGU7_9STRA|nr:Leucine Rich Repeat [Seminavis robusta]|eukprot:Sro598_g172980.1 Leucine Rich Repeat (529) ;mRNA; r:12773-14536
MSHSKSNGTPHGVLHDEVDVDEMIVGNVSDSPLRTLRCPNNLSSSAMSSVSFRHSQLSVMSHDVQDILEEDEDDDVEEGTATVQKQPKDLQSVCSKGTALTASTLASGGSAFARVEKGGSLPSSSTASRWFPFRNPFAANTRAQAGAAKRAQAHKHTRQSFHLNTLNTLNEGEEATEITDESGTLIIALVVVYFTGQMDSFLPSPTTKDQARRSLTPIQVETRIRESLPSYSLVALQDPNSPQAHAMSWMRTHPSLLDGMDDYPEWRILQVFAMATFYHAFQGDSWPKRQKKDWLSYDVQECNWGDEGVAVQGGRLKDLNLDWLVGYGAPTNIVPITAFDDMALPREMEFLTELETLGILNCGVSADLSDMLPTQLLQLTNLRRLSLGDNNFRGSIPTHVGAMTSLQHLSFGNNLLTGNIPSSLGLLSTNLQELMLFGNGLSSTLPTELANLAQLTGLSVIGNDITGTIPSQLASLSQLEWLYLENNSGIVGSVPSVICELPFLSSVLVDCTVDCGTCAQDVCECLQE